MVVLRMGKCRRRLSSGVHPIGRNLDCTIVVDDPAVSRYHARLEVHRSGQAILEDLGSTNGTLLNGARLRPHERRVLGEGDTVTVGMVVLSLEPGHAETGTSEATGLHARLGRPTLERRPALELRGAPEALSLRDPLAATVPPRPRSASRRTTDLLAVVGGPGRVLVLEHDQAAAHVLSELMSAAFHVEMVDNPVEALTHLGRSPYEVLLCAERLPDGQAGRDLLARAARLQPALAGVLLSDRPSIQLENFPADERVAAVLRRPPEPRLLERWIATGVRAARLRRASLRLERAMGPV